MGTYAPGLEGIVAARTRLSLVDGQKGILVIGGFPVEERAPKAAFEETVFLLWNDRLPTRDELANLQRRLAAARTLPVATATLLRNAAQHKLPVIDALRMGAASLPATEDAHEDALRLVPRFPVIVAAYWRLSRGQEPIPGDPALGHAAHPPYQLSRPQTPAG